MTLASLEPPPRDGHPTALDLERLAFDELPRPALAAHVGQCPRCSQQVATLRVERDAFLIQRPAHAFAARLTPARPPFWRRPLALLMPLAAAAAAAAALVLVALPAGEGEIKLKGPQVPVLQVLLSRDGQPAQPIARSTLRAGDVLKLKVTLPEDCFVFVANFDETGQFSRYFPGEERAVPLRRGEHLLPGSIVLDEFVGEEEIILVVSKVPLREADIAQALAKAWARAQKLEALQPDGLDAQWIRLRHRKVKP